MGRRIILFFAIFLLITISLPAASFARSQRNLAYRADTTWTTAVRLLRVDMGFELIERDQEAHFVLFRYREGEHEHSASLEVVERSLEDGRLGVRIIVSVPAMPSYVELHLIDRLEQKLRDEVGPPPPVPVAHEPVGVEEPEPETQQDQEQQDQ